jgi:outer membrane receptor protein involved in Fe transport
MRSSWMQCIALLALVALLAPVAFAQTTGRIEGRVVAENGDPLPGVTVQISSAALQGDRVAVTDAGGNFRFLGVPVGSYNLRAALEGFGIVEQPGINVAIDRTVSLALTMTAAFGDEVTVSGVAPIIDTTSTTGGASFGEELFSDLPTSRTFTGLAFAAPGVVTGGLGDNPSIGGASAAENRYIVDGLDTTDPAFGTIGTRVPEEFVREVAIKTGGYEAEYGGALGGVLNVITKSGGNELEGDVFAYFSDDSLQESSPAVPSIGENLGYEEYDFGAALGGKLIQDRLWYFAAVNPSYQDTFITTRGGLIEDTEEFDRVFYSGKLTFQLNPNHQIVASAFGDPTEGNDTIQNAYGRLGTTYEEGANNYGLTYNGTISSNLFVEAALGFYDEEVKEIPYDPSVPRYDIRSTGIYPLLEANGANCNGSLANLGQFTTFSWSPTCVGSTFQVDNNNRSRDEARAAGTWFGSTGTIDHEFKFGGVIRNVEYTDDASYPGRDLSPFFDSTGVLVDPTGLRGQRWLLGFTFSDGTPFALLLEYQQESKGETDEQAIFLQDSIRIGDYFSLNLGVRADAFESDGSALDGSGSDQTDNGLRRFLDFGFDDTVAPRVGFTWDVAKNGRSKLYGHFGHFYESVPLDINVRAFGEEIFNFFYFYYPEDGSLPTASNPGEWFYSYPLGVGTGIADDLEAMYTEEALVGFEYEVMPNVAIGIKGTQRSVENVIEDISVDGGHTYFITNPGGTVTHNPITGEQLSAPVHFPEPTRDYEALELTLNKRFSNNWQLFGSAVYSKNEGNYGGLFRQDNGQLDPNITSLFDLPDLLIGAYGLLPNDREYQFKLYGSYLWPFRLTTGFYAQYLDGTPISKLGAHPIYGANERFVVPRGSAGRTPDVWNLDVHFQYPISLGAGNDLKLIVDVFNITDQQEAATVSQTWTNASRGADGRPLPGLANDCGGPGTGDGTACPAGNPLWGTPTSYQTPRTIRLGAKFSF